MRQEAENAGEGVSLARITYVRQTVAMTLEGELSNDTKERANSQAALYRELLNYQRSDNLHQHVITRLKQLQQLDPTISLEPLGDISLGANAKPAAAKSETQCEKCFEVHRGECL
jgi:hypothetical protein